MTAAVRVAFATCAAMPDGFADDRPAAELAGADWRIWDDPDVDWAAYDRVVLRSVWDYTWRRDAFLAWCRAVGPERLRNPPELVAWNSDKRYLADLAAPTVPTRFVRDPAALGPLDGEVVVKPSVSGGARDTGRFSPATHADARALVARICAAGGTALVQPYLDGVDARGETALVFFAGELSHVLRKAPVLAPDEEAPVAEDDPLRVAAIMHDDGLVTAGTATDAEHELARAVIAEVRERFGTPLYARVDLVPGPGGEPVLIELEAIEPCLYLATADGAAERLAAAATRG